MGRKTARRRILYIHTTGSDKHPFFPQLPRRRPHPYSFFASFSFASAAALSASDCASVFDLSAFA